MFNFSIKESLNQLKEKKYDSSINKTIDFLNVYEDYQLKIMASSEGLKLNNIIRLNFIDGVGFRCYNLQQERYGRLPLCKSIEKFLNEKYKETFTQTENIVDFLKSELIDFYGHDNWKSFVDKQNMGDCQLIVNHIGDIAEHNNLDVEVHFGEIELDEEFHNVYENEYIDRFAHHWVTINGEIYEFSKGSLKDYIDWKDLYSVDIESREYLRVR